MAKNFRTRRGEIDLIMLDNKVLVFVEVRFRSSVNFGSAEESITAQKCQRLTAAAQAYMQREGLTEKVSARFDAVAISPDKSSDDKRVLHQLDTEYSPVVVNLNRDTGHWTQ